MERVKADARMKGVPVITTSEPTVREFFRVGGFEGNREGGFV